MSLIRASYMETGENFWADLAAVRSPASEGRLSVDIFQTPEEIIIQSALAGTENEDLDIAITKDEVVIKGSRKRKENIKKEHFVHQEIYWGKFSRQILLPEEIDVNRAKASLKNGLLTIRLPKLKS